MLDFLENTENEASLFFLSGFEITQEKTKEYEASVIVFQDHIDKCKINILILVK
jgi:hypothetical protein